MTFLQLYLLFGLSIIFALAAFFPRRLARPRRSPDPFKGLEREWKEIMGADMGPIADRKAL